VFKLIIAICCWWGGGSACPYPYKGGELGGALLPTIQQSVAMLCLGVSPKTVEPDDSEEDACMGGELAAHVPSCDGIMCPNGCVNPKP